MPFLLRNQSTEGNSKHSAQQEKVSRQRHPILIHCRGLRTEGATPVSESLLLYRWHLTYCSLVFRDALQRKSGLTNESGTENSLEI